MDAQLDMPSEVRHHLEKNMVGRKIDTFTVLRVLGPGNTAVTYEVQDQYGLRWALKLVTTESYGERAPFREIARFTEVEDDRFLVFPQQVDDWSLKLNNVQYSFVWFKSRIVRGQTLQKCFEQNMHFSARAEVTRYLENLTVALEELERLGFCHGDLHDRNIMREEIGKSGALPEVKYVMIDFSEAHPVAAPQEGLSKDIESFGKHLRTFSDVLYQREALSRDDERVLTALAHIPGLLSGTAPESMNIAKASDVLGRFKDGLRVAEEMPQKLKTPFDSLSSEYIANDALLADLCYTRSPWVSDLKENKNVLFIGPRGCGKTMLFRRLRLKTKAAVLSARISAGSLLQAKQKHERAVKAMRAEIEEDPYIGLYLPWESLFYMRFSDVSEAFVEENKAALVLFFNMAVLAEACSTLVLLPDFLGPVPQGLLAQINRLFQEEIGDIASELKLPEVVTSLEEIAGFSESVMRYVRRSIAYRNPVRACGSNDFVLRLILMIKAEIPAVSGRYFVIFMDDYTEERVPLALQDVLHPIICQRSNDLCFKISAHMFGCIYHSPRPLALDEGRNFHTVNLGSAYLKLDKRRKEGKLLLEILNERFKNCENYEGSIEEWLGSRSFPGGRRLSQALHDTSTRSQAYYHGVESLMDLCTGDYSEMIRMVGEIFREAGIAANAPVQLIAPQIQDKAILRVSREYLGRIRHIRPDGQKLFDILEAFGKLSQSLLYERAPIGQGKKATGAARKDPCDLLTIYVDNLTKASRSARLSWERLQKASVFVDIGLAPSQRTVIADRATLRRIYCPAFRTTLTSSEHLQATRGQFEHFMDQPREFCEKYFRQRVPDGSEQLNIFPKDSKGDTESQEVTVYIHIPEARDRVDFSKKSPEEWSKVAQGLPALQPIDRAVPKDYTFELFLGAMGYEERTVAASERLIKTGVRATHVLLMEFDLYPQATERRREDYERNIIALTGGKPHRPLHAPIGVQDPNFPQRLENMLKTLANSENAHIAFDCTSCPSAINLQTLKVLLDHPCHLTLLYTEAGLYFPTRDEWESGRARSFSARVPGPFEGVRYVSKPPALQSDDTGELPALLVLFPTFNTERTQNVLNDVDPASRIWLFGEPHDLGKDSYRIDMAKRFAAPAAHPGDPWSQLTTFDYRETLRTLGGIYADHRLKYRVVIMPHGSKMQAIGVSLFAAVHQVSMVFAMPKTYDTDRYSKGYIQVWALNLGDTRVLQQNLRQGRVLGRV